MRSRTLYALKSHLYLSMDYNDIDSVSGRPLRQAIRDLFPGCRWSPLEKAWTIRDIGRYPDIITRLSPDVMVSATCLYETWSKSMERPAPAKIIPPGIRDAMATTPYDHQCAALNFIRDRKGVAALFMEMGTGKTKAMIDWACWEASEARIDRILLLAPKSVLENEKEEFLKHAWSGVPWEITIPKGDGAGKAKIIGAPFESRKVVILNYEALLSQFVQNACESFLTGKDNGEGACMVCDESTRIKNGQAKRTLICKDLGQIAKNRIIMTGSPVDESPLDAFGQYQFLDRTVFPSSFAAFRATYCVLGGYEGKEVVAYKNMDEYKKRLWARAYRVTKEECLDLPPKVREVRKFGMESDQLAAYKEMSRELCVEMQNKEFTAPIVLTKFMRLQEITSGYLKTGNDVARFPGVNPKAQLMMETVEDSGAQKFIVWCREREEIAIACEVLKAAGILAVEFHGGTKDRDAAIQEFRSAPRRAAFVAQIQTGGLGLTLIEATLAIYFSNTFSLSDRSQSEDRCHRIGQTKSVTYVDLVAEESVDEYVLAAIKGKADVSADILKEGLNSWAQ